MEHRYDDGLVLFISDLHLDPARPAIIQLFLQFLQTRAPQARALYILGDLFEAWIGDDAVDPDQPVMAGMRALVEAGIPLYVMRGNRDFLLGEGFEAMTGAQLLPDPTLIHLHGHPTLLMHGDSLCIDDVEYQQFREMVRQPAWQQAFLSKSVEERKAYAQQARSESQGRNQSIDDYLMDVNQGAVESTLREHGVRRLIHGHTHRPAIHELEVDGEPARRIVLGDWFDQGSVLVCRDDDWDLEGLSLRG